MQLLRVLLILGVLVLPVASISAQSRVSERSGHAFVVIGPDTLTTRAWTARWVREEIDRTAPRLAKGLMAHDRVILSLLDTEDWPPTPPPPGPSAEFSERAYPHDLRTPLLLDDMRAVTRISRVRSFAQVIVERQAAGYRLTAQLLHADNLATPTHLTVASPSLRTAAREIAHQLVGEWDSSKRIGRAPAR